MSWSGDERALLRALDMIEAGVGLFGADGALLFGNQSMLGLLEANGEVHAGMQELLAKTKRKLSAADISSPATIEQIADRVVRSRGRAFRLRSSLFDPDLWTTGATFLITIEEFVSSGLTPEEVRRHFGLTQQEARVAILLAEGKTNAEIAADLYLSPHTARNYTRKVLEKLGVRSRARVGPRLQR